MTPSASSGEPGQPAFHRFSLPALALGLVLGMVGVICLRTGAGVPAGWGGRSATPAALPSRPGPWGDLELTPIVTEPPEAFIAAPPVEELRWHFREYTAARLKALLLELAMPAAQRESLENSPWQDTGRGIIVRPDPELVLRMDVRTRQQLYTLLGAFPENPRQFQPFRFRAAMAKNWLADAGLRPETESLVRGLLYPRGSAMAFADYDVVAPLLGDPAERTRLLKALSRRPTVLARLRVPPHSNTEPLAAYWSAGDRASDIFPLLASLGRQAGGADMGLVHLLPPLPRQLLYTYPRPSPDGDEVRRDCHWTSLNFLRSQWDDQFAGNEPAVREALGRFYAEVPDATRLGDIIVFEAADGSLLHSCSYVADQLVFTKNGPGQEVPWILMTSENVLSFYAAVADVRVRVFRAKPDADGGQTSPGG